MSRSVASLNAAFVFQVNGRVLNGASTHNLPQGYYYTLTDAPSAAEASQAAAAAAEGEGGTSAQPQSLASSPDAGIDTHTDPLGDRAPLASSSQPPTSSAVEGQTTESTEPVGSPQLQRLQEEGGLESGRGQRQSSSNAGSSEMRASQPGVSPFNQSSSQSSSQSTSQSIHQSVNPKKNHARLFQLMACVYANTDCAHQPSTTT